MCKKWSPVSTGTDVRTNTLALGLYALVPSSELKTIPSHTQPDKGTKFLDTSIVLPDTFFLVESVLVADPEQGVSRA